MFRRSSIAHALLGAFFALPLTLAAQQPTQFLAVVTPEPAPSAAIINVPKPAAQKPLTARWLDLTTFSVSQRYRNQYGDDGYHYFENGQNRTLLGGHIKLDAPGKYFIGFRASTGRSFNWAYSDYAGRGFTARMNDPSFDTDVTNPSGDPDVADAAAKDPAGVAYVGGVQSTGWQFYLRDLYFSATPVKNVTLEVGSFGIERGYSTEITTFDDDGYIAGERLRISDPHHLFFDQVSFTSAYFGDFLTPDIFSRGGSFTKSNYRQIAGRKQINSRVAISGEYNWISQNAHTSTTREAIVVDTHESRIFDKVRLEAYERNSHIFLQGDEEARRQGAAVVVEKKVGHWSGDVGIASIDRDYGVYSGSSFMQEVGFSFNGDNYNTGIRVFSHLNYKINPVVTAFGFYTRITGELDTNLDRQGLNAGLTFDLKALANAGRQVF